MRYVKLAFALFIMIVLFGGGAYYAKPQPESIKAINPADTQVELVAVTPEGVKLYRVVTPKGIVPTFVGVAPNGSIAIR